MKGKKITIILFAIAFILLISGGVASFLFSLKEDRALTLERMVVVNDEFDDFSNSTTAFEAYRDELYNNVLGSLFYDTLGGDDANIKNVLSNYEAMVDALEKKAKSLDSSILKNFDNDQLSYYSIQVYFKKNDSSLDDFPIMGYKHYNDNDISWTKDREATLNEDK